LFVVQTPFSANNRAAILIALYQSFSLPYDSNTTESVISDPAIHPISTLQGKYSNMHVKI